jgi:hypothetical protein
MGNDAQRRAAFTYNAAADFYDASHSVFGIISDAKQLNCSRYKMDREYLTLVAGPELPRFQLLNSSGLKER